MDTDESKREEQALDALIAASLRRVDSDRDVTQGEIHPFIEGDVILHPDDKQAMQKLGPDVIQNITSGQCSSSLDGKGMGDEVQESSSLFLAMNRKNAQNDLDETARREMERKRKELLGN